MTNRIQKVEKAINSMSDDKFNELLNELGVKEEKQWVPEYNERYWGVTSIGNPDYFVWEDNQYDNYALLMNNVFKTKEEAEAQRDFNIEKAKLIKEIEDSSDVIDWGDGVQRKYCLYIIEDVIEIDFHTMIDFGVPVTTNREWLENYIEENEADIKKYYFGKGE